MAKRFKDEGNLFFKSKDYENAIKKYAHVKMFTTTFLPKDNQNEFMSMMSAAKKSDITPDTKAEILELQA